MKTFFAIALMLFLTACGAPKFSGHAINGVDTTVVIVQNDRTKKGFLDAMARWLRDNGYDYSIVAPHSAREADKLTLEYDGHWAWDLALYLADAQIDAYQGGKLVGSVDYKVPYTANPNKFSDAEKRIRLMMDILFGKITPEEGRKMM